MMGFKFFSLGDLGEGLLLMAFATGLCQFFLALSPSIRWEASKITGVISFIVTVFSFCVLLYAFGIQDYTIKSVYLHSHADTPFLFRIAASWGHHEGSLMLWVMFSGWYGFLGGKFLKGFSESFKKTFLAVLGFNKIAFIGFILFFSNPFEELSIIPLEGKDLNPLLQDVSLLVHPPFLYMGFVGFLLPYALSIAYFLFPQNNVLYLENLRKSTAIPWAFLTLGIGLGSFWAYYELGWGGYWFWDPVENASLIPWLGGCILLHALGLWRQKHDFARWTLGWALLLYPLSILGTFMVRSGLLTSVHAFAFDPKRGFFIFCILLFFLGAAAYVFLKGKILENETSSLKKKKLYPSLFLILQNGIFLFFLSVVLIGTFYPLFSEVFLKVPLFVGPTYYTTLMAPCAICALVLLVFLPTSDNKRILRLYEREDVLSLLAGLVITLCLYRYKGEISFLGGLFLWASLSLCLRLFLHAFYVRKKISLFFAHFGIGVFMIGVLISALFVEEAQMLMKKGEKITFSGITLEMKELCLEDQTSYIRAQAVLEEEKGSFSVVPERRFYKVRKQETSEIALSFLRKTGFLSHFYVRLGEEVTPQVFEMHFKYYPLISLIWVGWGFIAIGGFFILFSNRARSPKR